MSVFRTAIVTIAHFLLAGVYLTVLFGFRTDFQFSGDIAWYTQLTFWLLYAIYLAFTFPLTLLVYAYPEILNLLGQHREPVWLLLQLGISYIQVRTIGCIHIRIPSRAVTLSEKTYVEQ